MDKLKALIARALYSKALQSETGQKMARWVPLISTAAYVVVAIGKVFAIAGSTEAETLLKTLHIKPEVSEVEIAAAVGAAAGLAKKLGTLFMQAQAQIVPPTQVPVLQTEEQFQDFLAAYNKLRASNVDFTKARELALAETIAHHAPVPVERQAQLQVEAQTKKAEAVAAVPADGNPV